MKSLLFISILVTIGILIVFFMRFFVKTTSDVVKRNVYYSNRKDKTNLIWISLLILLILSMLSLTMYGQDTKSLFLAGKMLNEEYVQTKTVGYIADIEGMVLCGRGRDNKINKIVFIPSENDIPVTITNEQYNDILYEMSNSLNLMRAEVMNYNTLLTIIFNKITYEVIIKVSGDQDKLNLIIILQKL